MSEDTEYQEPVAHARIVYLGPVSPHWEVYGDWGDRQTLDSFRARVLARLVLLPREDPQFRVGSRLPRRIHCLTASPWPTSGSSTGS